MGASLLDTHDARARAERRVDGLFSLAGRVAVVIGGSGRVGRMIARGLAEAGAAVAVTARSEARAAEVAAALAEAGGRVVGLPADVRDESSVHSLLRRAIEFGGGRVDVLVNSAVARPASSLADSSTEQWDASMAVNARGLFLACRAFAGPMLAQRAGVILNVASVMAGLAPDFRGGGPGRTTPVDYPFVKGGMVSLTRFLAAQLAPHNVRVNALSPGGVFSGTQSADFLDRYCQRVPLGRMASAEDIKAAAVFLVSDASAYLTGQNLVLDGGLSL